ncbi:hypothetical protein IFM89_010341 [Coptis chinensis]|uniref:Wall-associated receptor kinase C-terminal domain-containing protein n=1 Tax=Coptis chinensis TaxID=261450 RepID=A0A835HS31_9MAGN|nr:hypothetical protein IFM89_010341 [Coptis chinensis]
MFRNYLTIVDVDIVDQDCPQPRRNFSLQSTPYLRYYGGYTNMTFFYNCTNNTQNVQQLLPCLDIYNNSSHTNERSYAFAEGKIPIGFDGYKTCSESVVATFSYPATTNITQELKLGVKLDWSAPTTDCQYCEKSYGRCQFNSTSFRSCNQDSYGYVIGLPIIARKIITIGVPCGVGIVLTILLLVTEDWERSGGQCQYNTTGTVLVLLVSTATMESSEIELVHRRVWVYVQLLSLLTVAVYRKPHNILLDEDFCLKISDFGMAKLYPTREISVVSMVGARGTLVGFLTSWTFIVME